MSNLETVQGVYEAFGRGDVPAILSRLAESVEWDSGSTSRVPWLQERRGREGATAFFSSVAGLEFRKFAPKTFLEGPGVVVVLLDVEFSVKATGKSVAEEDQVHIWNFNERGEISRFRHRVDTEKHALACSR